MGVKRFLPLIKELCSDAFKTIQIKTLMGSTIAIDGTLWLYQILCAVRKSNDGAILNSKGDDITILNTLFSRLLFLKKMKIKPIFVFDGKPPEFKDDIIRNRKSAKKKAQDKIDCNDYTSSTEKKQLIQKSSHITKKDITNCRKLLDLMGIPYIDSPSEADAQLGYLYKNGIVDYVITEDSDIIIYGANKIIRNFKSSASTCELLDMNVFYEKISLSQRNLAEIAIILGCDYYPGIKGIGHKRILKMINENNIDINLVNEEDKELIKKIIKFYLEPIGIKPKETELNKKSNIIELVTFLKNYVQINEKKINLAMTYI
jgi:flap endonuclease-1